MGEREKSKLRRTISRWANTEHQDAVDMRRSFSDSSCVTIEQAPDRERVRLRGSIRSVTLTPRGGVPALEAELYDGSGILTLVWLGRRRIVGIEAGSSLQVEGRIGVQEGVRVMFNPRYELRAV